MIHKRDEIVAAVNSRVKRKNHKYGIEVTSSIKEALRLDRENGNTMWTNATNLEMSNVGIAFDILRAGQNAPPGWRKASSHQRLLIARILFADPVANLAIVENIPAEGRARGEKYTIRTEQISGVAIADIAALCADRAEQRETRIQITFGYPY